MVAKSKIILSFLGDEQHYAVEIMSVICGRDCGQKRQEVIKYCPIGNNKLPQSHLLTALWSKDIIHFNFITLASNMPALQMVFQHHLNYAEKEMIVCKDCGRSMKTHFDIKKAKEYIR